MPDRTFFTTAIDYTNAAPHIGHAYEKVLTDVLARFERLCRRPVYFLTGVDQHGQKVQQSAEKEGLSPLEFAEQCTAKFLALWSTLGVEFDGWAATTHPLHKQAVQRILQRLFEDGQLYKQGHRGFYSVRQEQFLTDKERNEAGEFGPEWGQVVELEEENYYFRLSAHKDWLLSFIDTHEKFVLPAFRRLELRNAVERLSGDLCISRPKKRLSWGIELPFDPEFVTYVWFDALINYISFAGYLADPGSGLPEFRSLWPAKAHVIGKDILIPAHGVYWPIMLHAIGFSDDEIPTLLVHGWWNISGAKMSKSLGNAVDPVVLAERYGVSALRYYLMADISTGRDADFSEERLRMRFNDELANNVGNLLNRSLNMAHRYRQGILRAATTTDADLLALSEGEAPRAVAAYTQAMEHYQIDASLEAAVGLARTCNQLIESSAPWKLAKDPDQAARLDAVLYHLAEALRLVAILLSPVLPEAALGILAQLNVAAPPHLADAVWGGLPDGHLLGTPVPLFPRLEAPPAAAD
ncbi:MAG: methionyl-tRNA synthetase [Verrucomicrobia bacterium]|nr:MAG: methionyl-tRNA synthetase [Verrucomicrobiota bacterium]